MRYFLELAYNGTRFVGYQIQPNGISVQETIEKALTTLLKHDVEIVGCGRTDAGVHASNYYIHFDTETLLPTTFLHSLNALVGKDIVIHKVLNVHAEAHARFDATQRSYTYFVDTNRNPFRQETSYWCPFIHQLDFDKMQEVASLLLNYTEFAPFCKSNTDAQTRVCFLTESYWKQDSINEQWTYHISGNRFLRGMVRLIVGACIYAGLGKTTKEKIQHSLDTQTPLSNAFSVPAQGLFLCNIRYPYL